MTKKEQYHSHIARLHGRALALASFAQELAKANLRSVYGEVAREDIAALRKQATAILDDAQHIRAVLDAETSAKQLELGAFVVEPEKVQ